MQWLFKVQKDDLYFFLYRVGCRWYFFKAILLGFHFPQQSHTKQCSYENTWSYELFIQKCRGGIFLTFFALLWNALIVNIWLFSILNKSIILLCAVHASILFFFSYPVHVKIFWLLAEVGCVVRNCMQRKALLLRHLHSPKLI